ncbi:MAG: HEAT repeat domain-containing protein [Deltaproteobacteria bacterium]|nr:HEAT repeat domain-containing protein [Deltaproteobacteria bacterium]
MTETALQLKAIEALVNIHAAVQNDQLYAPVDPTITNLIETLYLNLADTLRQDAPLVFAALEKKSPDGENISNQQVDKTVHVSSLLDIILGLGVKSISFDKDSEKEELHILINLLAKNPKPVHDEGDLYKPMVENETADIYPVNEVNVETEKSQVIVSGPDIAEDRISESIASDEGDLPKPVDENKTADIYPVNEVNVEIEKSQVIFSEPDIAEDQISGSIARMEKVFTRMNVLEGSVESIPSEDTMDMVKKLSVRAAEWVEKETTCTPEYKETCHRLQTLLQEFISNGFLAEATPIINVFSKINNGTLKKDDKVQEVSSEVLLNLASDNNINILFKEIINERNKKYEACQIFAGFGKVVISKLLNALRNASDSKARISMIHVIEEMGPTVIPAIAESINMSAPWYYLRNMAYILGRIGNEDSVDILKPLLLHKDKRVCREAFKSIGQTGGNKRGPLLLFALPEVDQELRVNIIEMLGKIRCAEAVTDLQDMLKSKSSMAKDDQISLKEKICKALGAIGSPEAIKILSEVAGSKSFLGIQSYPTEVKYAAKRVLAYINRK